MIIYVQAVTTGGYRKYANDSIVLLTVLVFFVIVTIHEWGHYYFAKRAGILVREFAIGFGPKLFSFKRGETKFTLGLVPAGGYVRWLAKIRKLSKYSQVRR